MSDSLKLAASGGSQQDSDETAPERSRSTAKSRGAAAERQALRLARVVEAQIIPRLVLARTAVAKGAADSAAEGWKPNAEHVARFADLALGPVDDAMAAYVGEMRAQGASIETLYLDLLAPAARRLGELWVADLCDFTEVTVGLCRLQQTLRDLSRTFLSDSERPAQGRRALLAPGPGEQHTFGLTMVADFFRRAGWEVWSDPPPLGGGLVRIVRNDWFAVVGISVSSDLRLDTLAAGVRALRQASRNPDIGVLVGGPVFSEKPDLALRVGADATALDARQAVLLAQIWAP